MLGSKGPLGAARLRSSHGVSCCELTRVWRMRPRPYTCARLSLEGDAAGNVFRRLGRISTVSASSLAVCCRSGDDVAEAVRCGVDRVGEGKDARGGVRVRAG